MNCRRSSAGVRTCTNITAPAVWSSIGPRSWSFCGLQCCLQQSFGETWQCRAHCTGVEWFSGKWAGLDNSLTLSPALSVCPLSLFLSCNYTFHLFIPPSHFITIFLTTESLFYLPPSLSRSLSRSLACSLTLQWLLQCSDISLEKYKLLLRSLSLSIIYLFSHQSISTCCAGWLTALWNILMGRKSRRINTIVTAICEHDTHSDVLAQSTKME